MLARSLLPLLVCDCAAPWDTTVYATDSSSFGYALLRRTLPAKIVGDVGRHSERWIFNFEDAVEARLHALQGSDAVVTNAESAKKIKDIVAELQARSTQAMRSAPKSCTENLDSFPEVPASLLNEEDWQHVFHAKMGLQSEHSSD